MRIVLDTNVFVSGILFGGLPHQIIEAWGRGGLELIVSPAILEEYQRVAEDLAATKGVDIAPFIQLLAVKSTIWNPPPIKEQICSDPDDHKFIECAVFSKTALIVTGDKALLAVGRFRGIKIITPAEFVRRYLEA